MGTTRFPDNDDEVWDACSPVDHAIMRTYPGYGGRYIKKYKDDIIHGRWRSLLEKAFRYFNKRPMIDRWRAFGIIYYYCALVCRYQRNSEIRQ